MSNRGRLYRRQHQLRVYKKRLKKMSVGFNFFMNIRGQRIFNPEWFDLIESRFYIYKNVSTTNWDSKYRAKWRYPYGIFNKTNRSRISLKKETNKIKEEYGY